MRENIPPELLAGFVQAFGADGPRLAEACGELQSTAQDAGAACILGIARASEPGEFLFPTTMHAQGPAPRVVLMAVELCTSLLKEPGILALDREQMITTFAKALGCVCEPETMLLGAELCAALLEQPVLFDLDCGQAITAFAGALGSLCRPETLLRLSAELHAAGVIAGEEQHGFETR